MYYLLSLAGGYLAYKFRVELGFMLLKTITRIEMSYNNWYKLNYGNNEYKVFVKSENDDGVVDYDNSSNIYTIEYYFKNKTYRIVGSDLVKITDYVENIDTKINEYNTCKTYRWIAAVDENGNCHLDDLKKLAGPLGDFYEHANLLINPKHVEFMKDHTITVTDFRLDEFIIMDSIELN
jgi:hypothetical protein